MERGALDRIIEGQKQECERLLSQRYIERLASSGRSRWLASPLVKVILGPRRAGKSSFALALLRGRPFLYFNFDDPLVLEKSLDLEDLLDALHRVYGQETRFVLFDEIQNLPGWELFVSRLQRRGYNLVITGSNANLLSRELATHLTGRHVPIEIMPFSFSEFLAAKGTVLVNEDLSRLYLESGGFPEVVLGGQEPRGYLDVLFDSLLFKDVVKRHRIRFSSQIDNLGRYLLDNVSGRYTFRRLAAALDFKSIATLEKYLSYFTEAYLTFSLSVFSYKSGIRLKSPKKIYVVDNGFIAAKALRQSPDSGKLLENLIFTELLKQGFVPNRNLFYYQTRNGREVDFLLEDASGKELLQVCYDLSSSETKSRETKALIEAAGELKANTLTIVTWRETGEMVNNGLKIKVLALSDWLVARRVERAETKPLK